VWEHANLAQKNLTVVDLVPGEFFILPVVIQNLRVETKAVLEVWRDPELPDTYVSLVHRTKAFFASSRPRPRPLQLPPPRPEPEPDQLMDCGGVEPWRTDRVGGVLTSRHPDRILRRFPQAVELRVGPGDRVRVPVALASEAPTGFGLKIAAPEHAEPGTRFTTHLVHRQAGGKRLVGGVAVQVRVRAPTQLAEDGADFRSVAIRDPRTRWGSCSRRGNLSFSWRLLLAPADVLHYVVVHELCHLREPSHQKAFWRLLGSVQPGWQRELRWLREHGQELHDYRPEVPVESLERRRSPAP